MTSSEESEKRQSQRTSRLLSVWPTDLLKEWRRRTRYGKLRYLMMLPAYIAGWAVILLLGGIMAVGFYGLVLLWRGWLKFSRWSPSIYRGERDDA